MYDFIHDISLRPEPFSHYTAKELWTRPHLAHQMLGFHLNQETDLASHRFEMIDSVTHWIDYELSLTGKSLCDLGCGPGLYTERFAKYGASVTGVDFSKYTLDYARKQTNQSIRYIQADYLSDDLPSGFDVITLIYTDFCVLSRDQRITLLDRIRSMLNPGGYIVLDVAGMGSMKGRKEFCLIEEKLMGGFWASGDYVGIQKSFIYEDQHLALDRYVIVEPNETWEVFNWFQHYTPEIIEDELNQAGFIVTKMAGDLAGAPLTPDGNLIGLIASAA